MNRVKSESRRDEEDFWAGSFGDDYVERNSLERLLPTSLHFFATALKSAAKIESAIEFGANIGTNLIALHKLFPGQRQMGIEVNRKAATMLENNIGATNVFPGSVLDYQVSGKYDLVVSKGFLIHVHPENLVEIYEKIHQCSRRYILIGEYYSPSPITINYRGNHEKLFKRDFAGEMLDRYPDLKLVDYGFVYHRDEKFPQDDLNWFLMERINQS